MVKILTREQWIKKGKLYHRVSVIAFKMQRLFSGHNPSRRDLIIETEFGKVRTLWYGFENSVKTPVYFDMHGGGFVLGSADMDDAMNLEILKKVGCKIISIDYAKAPDFPFPAALNQVYAVINHVWENAEKYAIDRDKMAIGGHSAGGNLATSACMLAKKEGKFQFRCQIMDYPALDLATDPYEKPQLKGSVSPDMMMMFNACYFEPAQAKNPLVSPVFADPEELKGLPPALFILAGRDSLNPEGRKYCSQLENVGVKTECHEYRDSAHGFTYKRSEYAHDAVGKMSAFLKKYLY